MKCCSVHELFRPCKRSFIFAAESLNFLFDSRENYQVLPLSALLNLLDPGRLTISVRKRVSPGPLSFTFPEFNYVNISKYNANHGKDTTQTWYGIVT